MPRNPKLFIKGTLIEVSSRIQEGLPLPPNELSNLLIGNILARAQTLYPVKIVAYCFMQNHFHILLVVNNPEDVSGFVCYLKRESGHVINRLFGRRQHSVWCEGFDNPVILDPETTIKRLNYIYLNPVSSGFVTRVKDWCLSSASWVDFSKEVSKRYFKPTPRNRIPCLPEGRLSEAEIGKLCRELSDLPGGYYTLKIEPHAWKECFSDTKGGGFYELHELIFERIRIEEDRLQKEREEEGRSCPSKSTLETQDIRIRYRPKKFGKRMLCLASDKSTRVAFLGWLKNLSKELPRYLKQRGKDYQKTLHYPPGFFAPGGFLSASILPACTPIPIIS